MYVALKNIVIMTKNGTCLKIIVSYCGFQDYYIENRILVNGLVELDSMIVRDNFDCSKILCIKIEEPIPKSLIEHAISRFADKLNNAGVIGAYNIHPMGESFADGRPHFVDIFSNDDTVRQFRYVIECNPPQK